MGQTGYSVNTLCFFNVARRSSANANTIRFELPELFESANGQPSQLNSNIRSDKQLT